VFEPLVHLFGPRAGGNQFGRASVGLLEIANVWLAICAVVHVDDTVIVDTEAEIDEARLLFVRLAKLLQCQQNEAKAVPPRGQRGGMVQATCLGPTLTLPQSETEIHGGILCKLSLPADKVDKYYQHLQAHRSANRLPPGAAAKRAGSMEWAASVAFGRAARAFLWPLRERQRSESKDARLTPALDASLGALCGFVREVRTMVLHAADADRRTIYGFVDASRSPGQRGCLGGLLLDSTGGAFFIEEIAGPATEWLPQQAGNDINESEALPR
jgi:hypothetical protein